MCTHTWATPETRQTLSTMTQGITDRQFFEALKNRHSRNATALDRYRRFFFYCPWVAESEDAIFDLLEARGFNELMVSMPNEIQRYAAAENITDEQMVNPFDP